MTETVFDPLRRKNVALTPEEKVRQWFISLLLGSAGVPAHMMMSEVAMTHGGKRYRADILVYAPGLSPLCVVECKRQDVTIDGLVADQALRYNAALGVKYIILTNGKETLGFREKDGTFIRMDAIPNYREMTCQQ